MSEFKRAVRVAEEVRETLSALIVEGLKDPTIGFVTVTDVKMSDDLRQAKVFVSIYGEAQNQASSLAALQRAASYLRRELGTRLRLRYTPELKFFVDETIARGARIETLLRKIEVGDLSDPRADASTDIVAVDTGRSVDSMGEHASGPLPPVVKPDQKSPHGRFKKKRAKVKPRRVASKRGSARR